MGGSRVDDRTAGIMADTNSSGQSGSGAPGTRGRTLAIVILSVFAAILVGIIIWLVATSNATPAPTPTPSPTATPSPTPSPTPTPTSTATSGVGTCGLSTLTITLGETQGAAGSRYVPIVFANKGSAPCTLQGYPAVSFVGDGNGTAIGAPADNDPTTPPTAQTVQPGSSVTSLLRVAVAQNFAGCTVVTPDGFRIAPPGSSASAFVAFTSLQACDNASIHLLTVQSVAPTP
jgi:hypothetical protein